MANLHALCKRSFGNFAAGAGIYMDRGALALYSVGHWRTKNGKLRIAEFRPPVDKCTGALNDNSAWIEMYDEKYFRGRRFALRGKTNLTVAKLSSANAQGSGFDNNTSSLRFQLPVGTKCTFYEHPNFKGKRLLTIVGTGNPDEIVRLHKKVEGKISSMKCA